MVNPDKMNTEEITDYATKAFTECQESIVAEIGIVMADMVEKNYDKAYLRLRMLRDELVTDINITLKKESSNIDQDNA